MKMDPSVQDLEEKNKSFFWKLLLAHEKKYDSELERLISFSVPRPWPHKFLSPRSFTRCGFYYTGSKDIVKCHFCKQTASGWGIGDRPEEEHFEFSSRCICPLQNGFQTDNIPIPDNYNYVDPNPPGFPFLQQYQNQYQSQYQDPQQLNLNPDYMESPENMGNMGESPSAPYKYQFQYSNDYNHLHFYFHPDQIYCYGYTDRQSQNQQRNPLNNNNENNFTNKNKNSNNNIVLISTNGGPKCKNFQTISSRLETFKTAENGEDLQTESTKIWDESKKPPAELMALLGFFYSDNSNSNPDVNPTLVCYHCEGVLAEDKLTRESDPYEEHKQLYPDCLLSKLPKVQDPLVEGFEAAGESSSSLEKPGEDQQNQKEEIVNESDESENEIKKESIMKPDKRKKKDDGTLTPDPTSLECKMCKFRTMTTVLVKCGHMVACDFCIRDVDFCPECDTPAPYIVRIPKPLTI